MDDASKPGGFTVADAPPSDERPSDTEASRSPQREKIVDAVQAAGVRFWRDPDGHAFATVPCSIEKLDGAIMHLRVRGRKFALICRQLGQN